MSKASAKKRPTKKRPTKKRPTKKAPPRSSAAARSRRPRAPARGSASTSAGGQPFPVVGIGASAGGLDAFKRFFGAMPVDSGMAFVLIPHLDPTHDSLMVDLLERQTAMPVREAKDGTPVRPNHVYVIPPNADLTINDRSLRVWQPPRRRSQTSIDSFLHSLAVDQHEMAVGIVLSGTGQHGTAGLTAIKQAGGTVLAQTPESAEHDQMPLSAIAAGVVDDVLAPEQMPEALARLSVDSVPEGDFTTDRLDQILLLLRVQAKRDFRGYRTSMLQRRVKRRMGLGRLDTVVGYIQYLGAHPDEVQALSKDLLIGVTTFFREPSAFRVLERIVIPDLIERVDRAHGGERPVRVWVPGCATGEEAYSIAILFFEQFALAKRPVSLQIFATDVDDEALDVARAGLYAETIGTEVSPEQLRRFFTPTEDHRYQISQALREAVTFAPQNLIADAPFSKIDLIVCRNVLIYLEPDVQAKVIALFDFGLVDGGYLMLGPAESIGAATDRFEPVSRKWRVFRRTGVERHGFVEIPIVPSDATRPPGRVRDQRKRPAAASADLLHRALLDDLAPAAVLINSRYEILSVIGPVADYLEFPPGELTRDLLAMARPGLRTSIRRACQRVPQDHCAVTEANAQVKRRSKYVSCRVHSRPVPDGADVKDSHGLVLVTFEDVPARHGAAAKLRPAPAPGSAGESTLVRQLEEDLRATREDQQVTIDDLKMANEDLKASHEELMSMNEELQSTNEEMETSKEELQSLNEELITVNSQLQDKMQELDSAQNDMVNLLASTEIATVFLDTTLCIKRFTPPTGRLLNLLATDVGRPFCDISLRVVDPALLEDCRRVLEKLTPVETVARADDGTAYLRRVLPYRTADRHIDGVVITWVDITQRLAAETGARHLSTVLRDSHDAVALLDLEGRIIGWNRGAESLYGWTEAEARTMGVLDLVPSAHQAVTADLIRRVAHGRPVSESLEVQRMTKDGRIRDVSLTLTLVRDEAGRLDAIVTTERDVTDLKAGLIARQAVKLYQRIIEQFPAGAVLCEEEHITMNQAAEVITGYERGELPTVDAWCAALHGSRAHELRSWYKPTRSPEKPARSASFSIVRKDGRTRHVEFTVSRLSDSHQLWTLLDMTERDQIEQALRRSEDYLRSIVDTAGEAIITIDSQSAITSFNPAAERMFGCSADEVLGENVRLLMPQPYRDEHDAYVARYLKTGEPHVIGSGREVVGQRKDGSTFPLFVTVSEIDHTGRFVGILRDLSEQRELEWRLAESQVEERRHLAMELHDGLGGHLTGIGLMAQSLEGTLAVGNPQQAGRLNELLQGIDEATGSFESPFESWIRSRPFPKVSWWH